MTKSINFADKVYDICQKNPEVIEIMKELGFKEITNPGMLNTAGRFMTIPKGAQLKKIDLEYIKQVFREKGYEVIE